MNMRLLAVIPVSVIYLCLAAMADAPVRTAVISEVDGTVSIRRALDKAWVPAEKGMPLEEGDAVKTGTDSYAVVDIGTPDRGASVEVKPNSQLGIAELFKKDTKTTDKTLLDLAVGEVLVKTEKLKTEDSRFEVKTPTSIIGVRGTKFSVKVEAL
ncbi:MAG: FecR domain-containing protein [Candidatus Omnitrophica bacterium]|nr:FecR domain-containing protein [Candidatus Omnitrophota bacterium]